MARASTRTGIAGGPPAAATTVLNRVQCAVGARVLHHVFSKITVGGLTLHRPRGAGTRFYGDPHSPIQGEMTFHDDHLAWEIVTLSELGLGMGYVEDRWTSPSPYDALLVLLLNEHRFRRVLLGGHRLDPGAFRTVRDIRRKARNTGLIEHCREQIGLTYDIGNDFYRFMLGPTMAYSCAIWPTPDASLDEAQRYKFDLIIEKLGIERSHRVLDVGCGWGTLCAHVHERTGATVRGIALSHNQVDGARERFPDLDFEYKDYREERGRYDRIVSVGMMEHVGPANVPLFLDRIADLLEPGGRALIHYLGPYDNIFIDERHVPHPNWGAVLMPGAQSPTHAQFVRAVMGCARLRILHSETFALHYARTGKCWNENLARHRDEILERYPLSVYKSHEYAWHLGSAAMETGYGLVQFVLEKQRYGAPYRDSAVDVVATRARSLRRKNGAA